MTEQTKTVLIVAASIFIGVGAFTYGALTANPQQTPNNIVEQSPTPKPLDLNKLLLSERSTIMGVLKAKYPNIDTQYVIAEGKLYDKGEWYGTTLTYKAKDTMNRDTLRVLMQKKQGIWTLRTTPPQILLSTVEFPDVPKSILKAINEPVSLPAGNESSPEVTASE